MKILGIGNAIVDVLCKDDDKFLVKEFFIKNSSLTLQSTSTIAFPTPKIFIFMLFL